MINKRKRCARKLIGKLVKKPAAEVAKLFEGYLLKQREEEQLRTKLSALGYYVAYDGKLRVNTSVSRV
jgi:hypothetical protein